MFWRALTNLDPQAYKILMLKTLFHNAWYFTPLT